MNENQTRPGHEFAPTPLHSLPRPPYRVLVVEDDDSLRQLNTEVLKQSGYEVDAAADGDVAWKTLQLTRYDLVITDQKMARVSGIELLMKLRAARMDLPVIMATGTAPQAEFCRQPWLKPAAVLLKPYTLPELLGVVRAVLSAAECPPPQIHALLTWGGQSSTGGLRLSPR